MRHVAALCSGLLVSTLPGFPGPVWTPLAVVGLCQIRDDVLTRVTELRRRLERTDEYDDYDERLMWMP
jgi:hypothetical protein